jgi:hypothetical protein
VPITTSTPLTPRRSLVLAFHLGKDNTCLHSNACVIHVTPDVCQDLGFESKLANSFTIQPGLFRCSGGSEFDVFNSESIQRLGNRNFRLRIKECICKLLSFCALGPGKPGITNIQTTYIPLRVLSMILKLDMLLRKSAYRGAYGFLRCCCVASTRSAEVPFKPLIGRVSPTATISVLSCALLDDVLSVWHILEVFWGNERGESVREWLKGKASNLTVVYIRVRSADLLLRIPPQQIHN